MASISHSSTRTGVPASEVTASTITIAPCLCAICVRSLASDWQPVEVSAWTKATIFASLFFFSASDLLRIDRLAPFVLDQHRRAAAADHVFQHAAAEHAVLAHDHLVAGRDHVDEAVLHADRARARQRE